MRKTKIDWCDSSWNPVTGCLHGCEYCYARREANRFGGFEVRCGGELIPDEVRKMQNGINSIWSNTNGEKLHVFEYKPKRRMKSGVFQVAPYPYFFEPTLHLYRLGIPAQWKKSSNIFVCSMADLFGEWVPDEWIRQVFNACMTADQHRYLFLSKNPKREYQCSKLFPKLVDAWWGFSVTGPSDAEDLPFWGLKAFCSIEPILHGFTEPVITKLVRSVGWVIVGAETGNRKERVAPQKEWIDLIAYVCEAEGTPIFMKESLRQLMGDDFRQEYPW